MGFMFNRGPYRLLLGEANWLANGIGARLSRTSEDGITRDLLVVTGIGLVETNITLTSKTGPTEDLINDRIKYGCAAMVFPAVAPGPEVNKVLVYKQQNGEPIALVDITPITPTGTDINVAIDPAGLFYAQQ